MQYILRKNHMREESAYFAQVVNRVTYDYDRLVEEVTREGSILKDTETAAVMAELFKQLARLIRQGIAFRSPYLTLVPTIRGSFEHEDDEFDPLRHKVEVNVSVGQIIEEAAKQVQLTKAEEFLRTPLLKNFLDNNTERINSTLSAGHIHELGGKRLKIDDIEDPAQGVFLIRTDNNAETRISWLRENSSRRLAFKVPADLAPGDYFLEVRNNFGKTEETIRKGRFQYTLTQA